MSETIYRVQDLQGRGPWKPGFSHIWSEDHTEEWYLQRPSWWEQFGMEPMKIAITGMALGSGCLTLEGLRHWFTPAEYFSLKSLGYQAVRMEVGRILAQSPIQVVFERAKPLKEGAEPIELYEPQEAQETLPHHPTDHPRD